MSFLHTTRFNRGKLPHWEVEHGRYFITVRFTDSLPRETVLRLQETHLSLSAIPPQSEAFVALQRQYFQTMEKYLDAGTGECLLGDARCAAVVAEEFESLAEWFVDIPHFTIVPNHFHALGVPRSECVHSLAEIMKRVKGRTGKRIREIAGGAGAVWQREWFDRWVRNEAEWEKTVAYIRNNPVKAGLASEWQKHPWTK